MTELAVELQMSRMDIEPLCRDELIKFVRTYLNTSPIRPDDPLVRLARTAEMAIEAGVTGRRVQHECRKCYKQFDSYQGLTAHARLAHGKPTKCGICGREFGSESVRDMHQRKCRKP